jgi:group I intron endonuclease
MIGIYKITNPRGKIYIGSSIDIEHRINFHKKYFKDSPCIRLKNSLEKHGVKSHQFDILEEVNDVCLLYSRERYYIEMFDSFNNGLNMKMPHGEYSQEIKDKISNSLRGRKGAWEGKERKDHSEWLKENGSGLSYKRTPKHKEDLSIMMKNVWVERGDEIRKKISKNKIDAANCKSIKCCTLDIEFNSLKDACNALGMSPGGLCAHLKGHTYHIRGLVFTYI